MQVLFAIVVGIALAVAAIAPAAARDRTTSTPSTVAVPQNSHAGQGGNGTASASAVDNTPSIGSTNGDTVTAAPPSIPESGPPASLPPGLTTTTSNGNTNVPPSINVPPD